MSSNGTELAPSPSISTFASQRDIRRSSKKLQPQHQEPLSLSPQWFSPGASSSCLGSANGHRVSIHATFPESICGASSAASISLRGSVPSSACEEDVPVILDDDSPCGYAFSGERNEWGALRRRSNTVTNEPRARWSTFGRASRVQEEGGRSSSISSASTVTTRLRSSSASTMVTSFAPNAPVPPPKIAPTPPLKYDAGLGLPSPRINGPLSDVLIALGAARTAGLPHNKPDREPTIPFSDIARWEDEPSNAHKLDSFNEIKRQYTQLLRDTVDDNIPDYRPLPAAREPMPESLHQTTGTVYQRWSALVPPPSPLSIAMQKTPKAFHSKPKPSGSFAPRALKLLAKKIPKQEETVADGWGGKQKHPSWFPSLVKGPLLHQTAAARARSTSLEKGLTDVSVHRLPSHIDTVASAWEGRSSLAPSPFLLNQHHHFNLPSIEEGKASVVHNERERGDGGNRKTLYAVAGVFFVLFLINMLIIDAKVLPLSFSDVSRNLSQMGKYSTSPPTATAPLATISPSATSNALDTPSILTSSQLLAAPPLLASPQPTVSTVVVEVQASQPLASIATAPSVQTPQLSWLPAANIVAPTSPMSSATPIITTGAATTTNQVNAAAVSAAISQAARN